MLNSQVSVEYLFILGFAMIISLPLIILYHNYISDSSDELVLSQVHDIARTISDAAESVHFLGEPSQSTINIYLPSKVVGSSVANREIVFKVNTGSGISDIVAVSSVDLKGDLPKKQGNYFVTLIANDTKVDIGFR